MGTNLTYLNISCIYKKIFIYLFLLLFLSLKTKVTDEVLREEASRARQVCGRRLDIEGFAQYLNQPLTEAVQDIFSLFEEVQHASNILIRAHINQK